MQGFEDKVAVVTGASSGIGRAIASQLAAYGVKLCLLGRKLDALNEVTKSLKDISPDVASYQIDITLDEDIEKLKGILAEAGHFDFLIHSAGVISLGEMKTAALEDLDWQYRTNVRAPYALTQALLPMLISSQGQIVFINSTAGLAARAGVGQYAATKHALKALADSLREEVNSVGVRVISVYPGRTASPMQADICKTEGKIYNPERLLQPEDVAACVVNSLNLPRTAEVTDIHVRPFLKS